MNFDGRFTIDQSVEKVWQILAVDFADIGVWASSISFSRADESVTEAPEGAPVGARVCIAPGFGDVHETLVRFDDEARIFSYRAEASGMPSFVRDLQNTWSLRALGPDRTEVRSQAVIVLDAFPGVLVAPFMQLRLRRLRRLFGEELKHYAETGEIAPSKIRALERASRLAAT